LRSAVSGRGCHLRALPLRVGELRAVHLQRARGAARADAVEAPGTVGKSRRLLREPVPGLRLHQPRHPRPRLVLRLEGRHRRVRGWNR
ncbi:unnamed protein product, partial [Lampetra fluviatilis]